MKYIVGLLMAALLSSGLMVAATATSANAAYPASVVTKCGLTVKRGSFSVAVDSPGKRTPRGEAVLVIKRKGKVVEKRTVRFGGGDATSRTFQLPLKNGSYRAVLRAKPSQQVFKTCSRFTRVSIG